jgi:hypothetical protein
MENEETIAQGVFPAIDFIGFAVRICGECTTARGSALLCGDADADVDVCKSSGSRKNMRRFRASEEGILVVVSPSFRIWGILRWRKSALCGVMAENSEAVVGRWILKILNLWLCFLRSGYVGFYAGGRATYAALWLKIRKRLWEDGF